MKQVASALVKAQKAFGPALKSSSNPFFKTKYADLAACVEAVITGLNDNGIALLQQCNECKDGVVVETIFLHESGETWSAGKLYVPTPKQDPQGFGSALTYARRYSLMAACGIAPEDDDGNAASGTKTKPQAPAQPTPKPAPPKTDKPAGPVKWTKEQRETIWGRLKGLGYDEESARRFVHWALELSGTDTWTKDYASKVIEDFDGMVDAYSEQEMAQ